MGIRTQPKPRVPPPADWEDSGDDGDDGGEYIFSLSDVRLKGAAVCIVLSRNRREAIAQGYLMVDALTEAINKLRG